MGSMDKSETLDIEGTVALDGTLVEVEKTSNQSFTSGSWTNLTYDEEEKDIKNEFDLSNDKFVPEESGYYIFLGSAQYQVGADQDSLAMRLQDVTDGVTMFLTQFTASGVGDVVLPTSGLAPLTAENEYKIQVRNNQSSDTIVGTPAHTYLGIIKVIVE